MKDRNEYLIYKREYREEDYPHFLSYKKLKKGDSSLSFTNLEILKNPSLISLIFMESEKEEVNIDGEIKFVFSKKVGKEYFLGKTYYYNEIPKNAKISIVNCNGKYNEKLEKQNPKCVVTQNNLVFLVDKCPEIFFDESEKIVIAPEDLNKIKEITKDGIVYHSQDTQL